MEDDQNTNKDTFKIKLGIFFGYNGQNYKGMQYQKDTSVKTVQNTFQSALFNCGFILESNMTEIRRVKWSRAARTDKRVHALCNAISLKMEISKKYVKGDSVETKLFTKYQNKQNIDYNKIIAQLNAALPKDIKIYAIKKVTKKFDMRHDAKCRLYNYLIPTFVFQSYDDIKNNKQQTEEEIEQLITELRVKIKGYLGTHNFHNFTKRIKETDPRCFRYLINMEVEKVNPETVKEYCLQNNIENPNKITFLRFTLLGQSFIYHQIRKMIGMLIQWKVQSLPADILSIAFGMNKMAVFLAPAQGLYLNRMTFDIYNKKHDIPEKLLFNQQEDARIEEFRKEIQKIILGHQLKEKVFTNWVTAYYQNPKANYIYGQKEEGKESDEQVSDQN